MTDADVRVNIKVSILPCGSFVFAETVSPVERPEKDDEAKVTTPPYAFPQSTSPSLSAQLSEVEG